MGVGVGGWGGACYGCERIREDRSGQEAVRPVNYLPGNTGNPLR